jgi:hypothetical protein
MKRCLELLLEPGNEVFGNRYLLVVAAKRHLKILGDCERGLTPSKQEEACEERPSKERNEAYNRRFPLSLSLFQSIASALGF